MTPAPFPACPAPRAAPGARWPGALAGALLLVASSPALAQGGERQDGVGQDAVDAVTQPLSDLNLRNREIPPELVRAQAAPYDRGVTGDCTALQVEIDDLENVLGPDADAPQQEKGLANSALDLGGRLLGGLIPFRGLVRQISGAEAEEARWEAAIYAGVARRSFLKGFAAARECPRLDAAELQQLRQDKSIESAASLLGLGEDIPTDSGRSVE